MRTYGRLLVVLLLCCLLGGCAAVKGMMLRAAGITAQEEYQTYRALRAAGALDENGYAKDAMGDLAQGAEGTVTVSIAQNLALRMAYYTDANRQQPIETQVCYLQPGQSIYGRQSKVKLGYSNWRDLVEYRIYYYDAQGNALGDYDIVVPQAGDQGLILTLPGDFAGSISIVPIGAAQE